MFYPQPNVPLQPVLAPTISGLNLDYVSGTKFSIMPGFATDFTNQQVSIVMQSSSMIMVDITKVGAGGMDLAPAVANTLYAVMLINSSSGEAPVSAICTLTPNSPNLPAAYDSYRRIGWIFVNTGPVIGPFSQTGNSESRLIYYGFNLAILSGGTATSPTVVSAVGSPALTPPTAVAVLASIIFQSVGGTNNYCSIFEAGIPFAGGGVNVGGAPGEYTVPTLIPCSSTQLLQYFNSGAGQSCTIYLNGYEDIL